MSLLVEKSDQGTSTMLLQDACIGPDVEIENQLIRIYLCRETTDH